MTQARCYAAPAEDPELQTDIPYKTCTVDALFKVEGDAPEEFVADCNDYLKIFALPDPGGFGSCVGCGKQWNGMHAAMGLGPAVRWGLTHGEGECSGCGWPVRGMHYPKGRDGEELFSLRNGFLCYHPDGVEKAKT